MSRDQFELLLKFFHFSIYQEANADQDRLFKLRPLLDLLRTRFKSIYVPGPLFQLTKESYRGREDFYSHNIFLEKRTNTKSRYINWPLLTDIPGNLWSILASRVRLLVMGTLKLSFWNVIELWWLTTSLQVFLSQKVYCEMIPFLLEHCEAIELNRNMEWFRKRSNMVKSMVSRVVTA